MAKNLMGKTRPIDNPYLVINEGSWCWKILKMNCSLEKAKSNPYASAFCAVSSPNTFGSYDLGDTYLSDIGSAGKAYVIAELAKVEAALAAAAK